MTQHATLRNEVNHGNMEADARAAHKLKGFKCIYLALENNLKKNGSWVGTKMAAGTKWSHGSLSEPPRKLQRLRLERKQMRELAIYSHISEHLCCRRTRRR